MRHIIIAIFMAIPSFHSQAGDLATGMINGCLQTGSSLQACKCQANEVLSNVSEGELASFAQTVAKYSTKQITAKDVPLNYHLAIIGMASCKEKYGN
jgi:hypothetical protein